MARTVRSYNLETRSQRLKLKPRGKPYYVDGGRQNVQLGYRRLPGGNGTWSVRRYAGEKRYETAVFAQADDFADADGSKVLTYWQAQERAGSPDEPVITGPASSYSVADAIKDYFEEYEVRARTAAAAKETRYKLNVADRDLGSIRLSDLTTERLQRWLTKKASTEETGEDARRRGKASAMRLWRALRPALQRAFENKRVRTDEAWAHVKPFTKVESAHTRYISAPDARRFLNACSPEFRPLARAALETGCRYTELVTMKAQQYDSRSGHVLIPNSKGGGSRQIPLTDSGREFFDDLTAGRSAAALIFTHADGEPWGQSHQARPMREACEAAKIEPPISFHKLRHSYAAALAMASTPMAVIQQALGHSDLRMSQRYAHLAPSFITDEIRSKLPSFGTSSGKVKRIAR